MKPHFYFAVEHEDKNFWWFSVGLICFLCVAIGFIFGLIWAAPAEPPDWLDCIEFEECPIDEATKAPAKVIRT